jgi:glycosyltransferase involved in cell wall biosynthesis
MKISIITVCFNSSATIIDTLRSVAEQTYPDIEHLIIDGASQDNTLALVRLHGAHVSKVISENDSGIYDAMNKGLRLASGDVVGFLNSDDIFEDLTAVERIVSTFSSSASDAVYGDLVFVKPTDTTKAVRFWRPGPHATGACARGWMPPHPTFYAKRELLVSAGGFDLQYQFQADFDLMLRLFEVQQIYSTYLPSTLVRMRMGGATTGSFRNMICGNLEAAHACRQHGFSGGLQFLLRKIGRRLPQFFSRPVDV